MSGRARSQGGFGKTAPLPAGGTIFTGMRASFSRLRRPCCPSAVLDE
ncbi:hypothetical protein [Paraburkholderia unamae]